MPQERKEEMEKRRIEKKEEKKELNGFFLESSIVVPFTAHSPRWGQLRYSYIAV